MTDRQRPSAIQSDRLELVALLPAEVAALVAGDSHRAGLLAGVSFPQGWPNDPDARDGLSWHLTALQADATQTPWRIRVITDRSTREVIGSINLKGPPDAAGEVEIGWGLAEHHRDRGHGFEAAAAVLAWVWQQPGVRSVSATVPEDNLPSRRLAVKLGLARTGETRRDLPVWRTSVREARG